MAKTIMVVDDEKRLVSLVESYLSQEGYRVVSAYNGKEALTVARREKPDLIVLDVMMPEMDGYEFMRKHRADGNTPIILLTARVDDEEKVIGLEVGADDYMTKPFRPRELVARVRAVLRRAGDVKPDGRVLKAADIILDRDGRTVRVADAFVDLTPSEFDILAALMASPGRVYSRLDLLDIIQGVRYEGYERTIDTHIKNLRGKIETQPRNPRYIETVYGVGYRFKREQAMRSISTKLILAFLSIGIVSVTIIFLTARWNTRQEFIRFLSDQTRNDIVAALTSYYEANETWAGIESIWYQPGPGAHPQPGYGNGPPRRVPFILTDASGTILVGNDRYRVGTQIPAAERKDGIEITQDGDVVGVLIPMTVQFQGQPRELEFIERINRTLLYGALIGAVIALLLGIFLSRSLTRPIRELTRATHAVSEGDLSQQVPVRSQDELGELAQSFNRMSAELSRSVNARRQMTADIAHELRTPLSLILGHAEAVHDGVLPPTRENFEIIREEAARLEHLINDLRLLSLADAGELSIQLQSIEPQRLLNEVASLYYYRVQRKNITLQLDAAPDLPNIEVDPARMTQVLTNILDNALRHTPEGGQIVLAAKEVDRAIELSVKDSGPGLNGEDLDRIFERFYRADPSRQRDDGRSGLGLAIARSIVQAHGGQVSAESEPGAGLKVIIRLPKPSN